MIVTKVVEITIRDVIRYDDEKFSLYQFSNKLAKRIASETDIYDAVELTGNDALGYELDNPWATY